MLTAILPLTVFVLCLLMVSPFLGWMAAFIAKPIIDTAWTEANFFLGFTPLEIIGALLPAIVLLRMLLLAGDRPRGRLPMATVWAVYVATIVIGAIMYLVQDDYFGGFSFLFRGMNGVLAFYSIYVWFGDRDRFRWLLIALLIAGIFPMAMGFWEAMTGQHWRIRLGTQDQVRITGLYHNSNNLRYYAYLTLTAIGLYWIYFTRRQLLVKVLLAAYAVVAAVVLFRVYSKAGFAVVAVAGLAWVVMGRRIAWPAVIAVAVIGANALLDNAVFGQVSKTFQLDVAALTGEISEDRAFGGRLGGWRAQWADFRQQSFVDQMFGGGLRGSGRAAGTGHNDYMRSLQQTGFVGTAAYLSLLLSAGYLLVRNALRRRTPLNVVGVVVYMAWIIETIGFTPAVYSNFQWYGWGFMGLALAGVRGLDPAPARAASPRAAPAADTDTEPAPASGPAAPRGRPGQPPPGIAPARARS